MIIYSNYKFDNPKKVIQAFNNKNFFLALNEIEKLKNDFYLVGYISYQAKDIFLNKEISSKKPLLYFEVHKNYNDFTLEEPNKNADLFLKENITFEEYKKDIEEIKNLISNGTTYEVNYTYSNDVFTNSEGYNLFLNLIKNQKTKYCAYIKNIFEEILSFSPELFFKIENNKIITKPMKGTVKRKGEDEKEINFLKNDVKNLAENTMIVDLLRNDLSKIKNSKNITVDKLFEVETHKTLHQMTSTISASLDEINLKDILASIFPCGSITGAPKVSTMEIIDKIERYKRNIYCGAIGLIHKEKMEFSVPIRILEKKENKFQFYQGGAIVWKSDVLDEWEECKTKRLFLGENLNFNLIETILIKNNQPQLYFEHLKRLKKSCKELGFKFNNNLLNQKFENNKIARIVLNKNGEYKIQYREIDEIKTRKIIISDEKIYSQNSFLYFKTDFKPWYQKSYDLIKKKEIFDTIYFNEKEELTEGSRSNILILKNNELLTPKLSSGLLNGIMRQKMLEENKIKEKILHYEDLITSDKIFLINSIKGLVEVEL